jgi:hypothetical protein
MDILSLVISEIADVAEVLLIWGSTRFRRCNCSWPWKRSSRSPWTRRTSSGS